MMHDTHEQPIDLGNRQISGQTLPRLDANCEIQIYLPEIEFSTTNIFAEDRTAHRNDKLRKCDARASR
jgi:hypothetical protein